jgi:hypothetical protein
MRQPSRLRRIAKWTGLGICLLILAAWGVSLKYAASIPVGKSCRVIIDCRNVKIVLGSGATQLNRMFPRTSISAGPEPGVRFQWPAIRIGPAGGVHFIFVPAWLLLLAAAVPTGLLFYRDRRLIPPGHCGECGYDLTGNVSGVCPECGLKIVVPDAGPKVRC